MDASSTTTTTPASARALEDGRGSGDRTNAVPRATLWHRIEYALLRLGFFAVGLMPERVAYRCVGWLGETYLRLSKGRQTTALRMLRNAYPDETDDRKLLRLARKGTGNLFKVALDMVVVGKLIARGRFSERIDMTELVDSGLRPPWVGVTGHLGSWECGAIGVASLGSDAHVTARLMKNPFAQRFMLASRMRGGLHVHDRRGGIRGITRALDAGCIVLQVADQHQRLRGLVAPFFGELASTERAAATLAVRKRCPFVVAAGIRTGTGFRFKFVIEEIIEPELTGDVQRDIQRLVERMNDALGRLILRFPEQYLWIHNRYRDSVRESSQTAP